MNSPNLFWFHCGRCGSLFQSPAGDLADRLCSTCGADPCLSLVESPVAAVAPATEAIPAVDPPSDRQGTRRKVSGTQRKHRYFMLKLAAGWALVLAVIVFGARWLWNDAAPGQTPTAVPAKTVAMSNEDMEFLNRVAPKCAGIFSEFLAAGTPETRNQFVLTPILTSSRMALFYGLNPLTHVDPQSLKLAASTVLKLPAGKALETQWNATDGRKIEAVFREENGEWRLDWDHYARYSDYPWALFLAGSGEGEGEFRLLVRERLADERKASDALSLVLYAPRFGQPGEVGFASPEFMVSRHSRDGKLLDAAFQLARGGGQVFGSTLANLNPEGMIRARVKVRRLEVNMERKFEIGQVLACHWYALDEPGVAPAAAADAPPPANEARPANR